MAPTLASEFLRWASFGLSCFAFGVALSTFGLGVWTRRYYVRRSELFTILESLEVRIRLTPEGVAVAEAAIAGEEAAGNGGASREELELEE